MKKFIINEIFGIIALIILLIPQVAHTVYVFKVNSQYEEPWFAWCYAIGVDLAILIFTVKGWIRTAIMYSIGTLAQNLVYQFWPDTVWSAILLSVMLSATLFSFSHLFYFEDENHDHSENAASELALRLTAALDSGIKFHPLPYHCPACGEPFADSKKLNGHISGHKQKMDWHKDDYGDWEEQNQQRVTLSSQLFHDKNIKEINTNREK
ncbi:MAG: hypothetical protein ABJQ69_03745 [Ekhidna sp.]